MQKQNSINIFMKIIILLILIILIVFLLFKKDKIKKISKEEITGENLIQLCNLAYENNVKHNSNKKTLEMIKQNTERQIDDEYLGNYPNETNSVIINIKINDKTYTMGEIIKIQPDKLLDNYKTDKFERKTISRHENKKIAYLYYELKTK